MVSSASPRAISSDRARSRPRPRPNPSLMLAAIDWTESRICRTYSSDRGERSISRLTSSAARSAASNTSRSRCGIRRHVAAAAMQTRNHFASALPPPFRPSPFAVSPSAVRRPPSAVRRLRFRRFAVSPFRRFAVSPFRRFAVSRRVSPSSPFGVSRSLALAPFGTWRRSAVAQLGSSRRVRSISDPEGVCILLSLNRSLL
jgi:hypothetical protein